MSSHTDQSQNGASDKHEIHENYLEGLDLEGLELEDVVFLKFMIACRNNSNTEENRKKDEEWIAQRKEYRVATTLLSSVCRGNTENIKQEDFEKAQSVFHNSVLRLHEKCAPAPAPAAENGNGNGNKNGEGEGEGSSKQKAEHRNSKLFSELEESVHALTGSMLKYIDMFPLTLDTNTAGNEEEPRN